MKIERTMGYVKKAKLLAEIAGVNFVENIYYLLDGDNTYHTADIDDVEILRKAFVLYNETIFNKDVIVDKDGLMYLIELHEGDDYQDKNYDYVQLHLIDQNLEKKASGNKMRITESVIKTLEESSMSRYRNYYELLEEKESNPTFNIEVVKIFDGEKYTYYYACNNKENGEIDLIKVIFIGHRLLEEENHERFTFSYEVYKEMLVTGDIEESSPSELMNHVTNATNNDYDEDVDDETCGYCGHSVQQCNCELWD